MGQPNSKRARRRLRAKLENDPNLIYEFGRMMVRTVSAVERIDLGNNLYIEIENETWYELGRPQ
jgi:hypothetical protein